MKLICQKHNIFCRCFCTDDQSDMPADARGERDARDHRRPVRHDAVGQAGLFVRLVGEAGRWD